MSYIAPNSDVYIIKDCPLLPNYEHTYFFEDEDTQSTYFSEHAAYHLTEQSYQRAHKGTMRVQIVADNIYNANYMMFRNTAFGSKWFYAFITNVEYINNVTSEITYEIDVLQTWHFNYTLRMCLVEREHTATDNIGDHILPESVQVGEYVANTEGQILSTARNTYYVALISDTSLDDTHYHDSLYSGCVIRAFESTDYEGIEELVEDYIQDPDSIICIYTVPKEVFDGVTLNSDGSVKSNNTYTLDFSATAVAEGQTLDGYTPKNNKMYTYPYSFYRVITPQGDCLTCRYEFFDDLTPQFEITLPVTLPIHVVCRPMNYKNCTLGNTGESITLQGYPLIAWNYDAYQAYIAQNSVRHALGFVGAAGNAVSSGLRTAERTGSLQAGAASVAGSAASYWAGRLSEQYTASIQADPVKGSYSNGNGDIGAKHQTFYTNRMSVSYEYAKMIDQYFTKYGYAVNTLKQPNRSARPYYTYVKTADCAITGLVPADDKAKIESIYNNGITWWKYGATVGDYSVDNTV